MRDGKAFASLTSGLLARKGQARPAMRAQGFGFAAGKLDDLGWNDMGDDTPAPAPVRAPMVDFGRAGRSPVLRQQEEIAEALAAPAVIAPPPALAPAVEPAPEIAEARIVPPLPVAKAKRARVARPVAAEVPAVRAPREAGRKAAFTLRIEAERHLRLRLACAVQNRSAQQIVTAALDSFLATLPDVERLATSLSANSGGQENP
jgi:hypothetical protein